MAKTSVSAEGPHRATVSLTRLIDDLHFWPVAPFLLARENPLLQGLNLQALGYACAGEQLAGERAAR